MKIVQVTPLPNFILTIKAEDGRYGEFNVGPYLQYEAFTPLRDLAEFKKISNGGYYVEWDCGADLSADSIEAHWKVVSG